MSGAMTRREIRHALTLSPKTNIKKRYLDPCLEGGWIEMTIPEKPSSRNQRFRITPFGRACVEARQRA